MLSAISFLSCLALLAARLGTSLVWDEFLMRRDVDKHAYRSMVTQQSHLHILSADTSPEAFLL